MYFGGSFSSLEIRASNIVRMNKDPGRFTTLGSGLNGTCYALDVAEDGSLYAGGLFTTAGGTTVNRIAKWNGSAWSALGSGLNGTCNDIAIAQDGSLYAGGSFTTAGGGGANPIAKWNGLGWSALGRGLNAPVSSISIVHDG